MQTTKWTLGRITPGALMSLAITGLGLTGCSLDKPAEAPAHLACENLPNPGARSLFSLSPGHPVEKVIGSDTIGRVRHPRVRGASSFVPAVPGLTKSYLERIGDCEAFALSERTGHRHVAVVEYSRGGFRVGITSRDRSSAEGLTDYAYEQQKAAASAKGKSSLDPGPTSL